MNLETMIAKATCEYCRDSAPKSKNGKGHMVWCGGSACTPELYPEGHYRSCDSQAGNQELLRQLRVYIRAKIKAAQSKRRLSWSG
jgi:hypothetical protein